MSPRLAGGGPRIGFGEPFGEALRRPLAAEAIREGEGGERLDVRRGGREAPPRRPQLLAQGVAAERDEGLARYRVALAGAREDAPMCGNRTVLPSRRDRSDERHIG